MFATSPILTPWVRRTRKYALWHDASSRGRCLVASLDAHGHGSLHRRGMHPRDARTLARRDALQLARGVPEVV